MVGRVTPQWDALVQVSLEAADGRTELAYAAVDTGFTEFLSLPPALIARLGLPFAGLEDLTLADGSEAVLHVFDAVVHWHGRRTPVHALEAEGTPLIGMKLLRASRLTVDVVAGGRVEVRPLAHA
ncbi:MAG: clan AA aspartic protease [Planctomycetes bacterium]|nr:clan AA aspartic protease [Planctomycetota bacterium]